MIGQRFAVAEPLIGGVVGDHFLVGGVGGAASLWRRIVGDDGDVGLERQGFERQRSQSEEISAEQLSIPVGGLEEGNAVLVAGQRVGCEFRKVVGAIPVGIHDEWITAKTQFLHIAEAVTV